MLVTVVTVAICVAVHLIMDRFAPVLIGSSRHNLASQGKARQGHDGRTFAVDIIVAMERRFVVVMPVGSRHLDFALVVPEKLRTLDRGRPWRDSQFASTRLSPSRDMSR